MKKITKKYKTIIDRMRDSLCPVCGQSVDDGYGEITVGPKLVYQRVICHHCEAKWNEFYTLTGLEIEETVDVEFEIEDDDLSYVENVPEILAAVLNMKTMLPALMNIDESFDKLIEQKLKEKNGG